MNINKITGDKGERRVTIKYIIKGYKIIARNFSCRYGELDIVAQRGHTVAIVEVKTRKNANYANAGDFVDLRKQDKLRKTADIFLQKNSLCDYTVRFDVAEVYTESNTINIIENAF